MRVYAPLLMPICILSMLAAAASGLSMYAALKRGVGIGVGGSARARGHLRMTSATDLQRSMMAQYAQEAAPSPPTLPSNSTLPQVKEGEQG